MSNRPSNRKSANSRYRSAAFTLIELMIVLGIILVLIGVLIPAIGAVRRAVNTVNTRQIISRLDAAINAYYADFHQYPGPFGNNQLVGAPQADVPAGTNPNPPQVLGMPLVSIDTTGVQTPLMMVTSSENLFLALSGGLSYTPLPAPAVFSYKVAIAEAGGGPGNLNPGNQKRSKGYMVITRDEATFAVGINPGQTMNAAGQWNVASGTLAGDTIVPEYIDKYPIASPILYLRASVGAAGKTVGASTTEIDSTPASAVYDPTVQYQIAQLSAAYVGAKQDATAAWQPDAIDYPMKADASGNTILSAGAESYLGNVATSTATAAATRQTRAANKDTYILISAGPDGKYGTSDDITNFH